VYDASTGNLKGRIEGFDDVVNGVSFFRGFVPNRPILATATGSRYFPPIRDHEDLVSVDDTIAIDFSDSRPKGLLSLHAIIRA
jgi:hypothetical protein